MGDKEIGFNYYTIAKVDVLPNDFYRLTIRDDYIRSNDTIIRLNCSKPPVVNSRIEVRALNI